MVTTFQLQVVSRVATDLDEFSFEKLERMLMTMRPNTDMIRIKGIAWGKLKCMLIDPAFNNIKFFVSKIQNYLIRSIIGIVEAA